MITWRRHYGIDTINQLWKNSRNNSSLDSTFMLSFISTQPKFSKQIVSTHQLRIDSIAMILMIFLAFSIFWALVYCVVIHLAAAAVLAHTVPHQDNSNVSIMTQHYCWLVLFTFVGVSGPLILIMGGNRSFRMGTERNPYTKHRIVMRSWVDLCSHTLGSVMYSGSDDNGWNNVDVGGGAAGADLSSTMVAGYYGLWICVWIWVAPGRRWIMNGEIERFFHGK